MKVNIFSLTIAALLVSSIFSLYGPNSSVVKLTTSNFNKEVINSADLWIVEFYAPWCGHCKNLAPEWEKAANALKGIVKVGGVDADSDKSLGGQFGVQGFPTIKFFGANKSAPIDYNGDRSADGIVRFVLEKIKEITNKRLTGKSESQQQKSSSSSGSNSKATTDKDVVILTDDNFENTVFNSKDMWLIEFYAPWCGHCKKLEPEWNQAASELKGKIKLAKVDATVHQKIASKYSIQGYPTIKIFPPGPKSDSNMQNYDGPRESAGIVSNALDLLEKFGVIPDVEQFTNENQFKEVCKDRTGVCIISFLPHIIDSSAKLRKSYIDAIKEATKSFKGKPIYFLWAQGADFFDFEEKLHLSFGYPAVVAINSNKKKYSVCRTAFGTENLKTFVSSKLFNNYFRSVNW
jgi:protein disulfide-isomerase A6